MRQFSKSEKLVMLKLAEECSELSSELLKACNKKFDTNMLKKIKSEIDDVYKRLEHVEYQLYHKKIVD